MYPSKSHYDIELGRVPTHEMHPSRSRHDRDLGRVPTHEMYPSNTRYEKELGRVPTNKDSDDDLRNLLSKQMTMSPELFERVYLQPKTQVSGELRKTLGNPTPIALLGLSVGLMPFSAAFMGWRGAGGFAVASTTASIWFGGFCCILAGIGEFLLGNTFPMMVFIGYGAHFLTFATLFIPAFNAIGYFGESADGVAGLGSPVTGQTPEFAASFGFYSLAMSILSVIFLVGSLRTNLVFVLMFVFASIGSACGAAAYWLTAQGNAELGEKMSVGLGACFFATDCLGWYLLLSVVIMTMELPIPDLPVFDLSTVIKARSRTKQE